MHLTLRLHKPRVINSECSLSPDLVLAVCQLHSPFTDERLSIPSAVLTRKRWKDVYNAVSAHSAYDQV